MDTIHPNSPSSHLMIDTVRAAIEQAVSQHCGRAWQVSTFQDLIEFASHGCAILSDGNYSVFAKFSGAAHGADQFEVELAGLRFLSEGADVLVPPPVGLVSVEGGLVMLLEAVQPVERGPREWRQIGQTLARIHSVRGQQCGHVRQGYFGPLYQDNRPMPDWTSFFIERRLWPRFMEAINSGHMPGVLIRRVEKFIERVPSLSIPDSPACLLHGDAQQNNFISTPDGAYVIDPAVFYGNPEYDLAYIDYFQPVPDEVFQGYREILPIDPTFQDRRDLWRVPAYLAIVGVEGASYLEMLSRAIDRYL